MKIAIHIAHIFFIVVGVYATTTSAINGTASNATKGSFGEGSVSSNGTAYTTNGTVQANETSENGVNGGNSEGGGDGSEDRGDGSKGGGDGGEGGENGGEINLEGLTLEQVCQTFGIEPKNCFCDFHETIQSICEIIKARDDNKANPPTIYTTFPKNDRIKGSLIIVASVFGLIGNAVVILVTLKNWRKYNYCHKLIGGLAISDFLFAILQLIEAIPMLWTHKWQYGLVMCKTILGAYNLSAWVSLGLILVIAIERYYGIVHPFSNGIHAIKISLMVIGLIVSGILIIIPMLVFLKIIGSGRCAEEWPKDRNPNESSPWNSKAYSWVLMFIGFLIPLAVIATLYGKIMQTLSKGSSSQALSNRQQEARVKENKRVMVILISILAFFVLLVFPIRIIWILKDHGVLDDVSPATFDALRMFGLVPYSFHVSVNPIIYSAIDRKFRKALRELFNMNSRDISYTMSSSDSRHTTMISNSNTQNGAIELKEH